MTTTTTTTGNTTTATITTTTITATAAEAATASVHVDPSPAGRPALGRPAVLLAELFEAHAPMVLGICRGMLRHTQEAEDAAQQTFLSAYASLCSGTSPREPAAWLATIARNECRTRVQRRMREPLAVHGAPAGSVDPTEQVVRAQELESLRHALVCLPSQQRQAFVLREFSGLSYDELAQALGVSRPAVESLLFRARQRLRASMRSALAGAATFPAGLRDWLAQFAGGSPDAPTTLAKFAALPVAAKIASATAGTALLTAGVAAVGPLDHDSAAKRTAVPAVRAADPAGKSRRMPVPERRTATARVAAAVSAPTRHVRGPVVHASRSESETARDSTAGRGEHTSGEADEHAANQGPRTEGDGRSQEHQRSPETGHDLARPTPAEHEVPEPSDSSGSDHSSGQTSEVHLSGGPGSSDSSGGSGGSSGHGDAPEPPDDSER